jgi:hypothetical protein
LEKRKKYKRVVFADNFGNLYGFERAVCSITKSNKFRVITPKIFA